MIHARFGSALRTRLIAAVLALGFLPLLPGAPAQAAPGTGTGRLVVELAPQASTSAIANVLQATVWKTAKTGRVMSEASELGRVVLVEANGILASARPIVAALLAALPAVARVEEEVAVATGGVTGGEQSQTPIFVDELNLASMKVQPALLDSGLPPPEGSSAHPAVRVAVLDGGFDLGHEALTDRWLPGYDAISLDSDPQDLGNDVDDDADGATDAGVGHGTAVAGVIAVAAPEARIRPVRILDDEGVGTTFTLAEGLRWAIDEGGGVSVINVSAGCPSSSGIVEAALTRARQMGILVVASAGNTGGSTPTYPGSSVRVLSVTGVDEDGARDPDASVGAAVDLAARSLDVVAPFPGTIDGYGLWYGTSFSAALVSGAAARVLQFFPGNAVDAGDDLLGCAAEFPPAAEPWDAWMGAGILDASALLED